MVTDTCIKDECFMAGLTGDFTKCPNYLANVFQNVRESQPVMVHDCAPKRTLLMVQELFNRQIGLQAAVEQTRNKNDNILKVFQVILEKAIDRDAFIEGNPRTVLGSDHTKEVLDAIG